MGTIAGEQSRPSWISRSCADLEHTPQLHVKPGLSPPTPGMLATYKTDGRCSPTGDVAQMVNRTYRLDSFHV